MAKAGGWSAALDRPALVLHAGASMGCSAAAQRGLTTLCASVARMRHGLMSERDARYPVYVARDMLTSVLDTPGLGNCSLCQAGSFASGSGAYPSAGWCWASVACSWTADPASCVCCLCGWVLSRDFALPSRMRGRKPRLLHPRVMEPCLDTVSERCCVVWHARRGSGEVGC